MKKILSIALAALLLSVQSVGAAPSLSQKLAGSILLQVESKGEAWYVNPADQQRYYLGRPADALAVMRQLGVGISNKNFAAFEKSGVPRSFSGKILLKVEDKGRAYYVFPKDMKMHSLGRPAEAFAVMRQLGIGISNNDLKNVAISGRSASPVATPAVVVPTPAPAPAPAPAPVPAPQPTQASIAPYLPGVVRIQCYDTQDRLVSVGSGTLVEGVYGNEYMKGVMTNLHVFIGASSCIAYSEELDEAFELGEMAFQYTEGTDFLVMKVLEPSPLLDFSVSQLPSCPNDIALATPMYIIGFPITSDFSKTITNGIISSRVNYNTGLPYMDYLVSAKIDAGNSGGLALAEYNHGYCLLGLPTALAAGEYEQLGVVQNMNNLQYELQQGNN